VGVVPRPRLEAVVASGNRADRADVHQVAREQRVDALLVERRDLAVAAARDDANLRVAVDLAHEADAPRAEDAAVAVQHQRRAEVDVGLHALAVERAARELHPAFAAAERVREILERALTALVADRAIERVIHQQELEDAGPRLDDVGGVGRNDHSVRARRGAGGLQLRHFLALYDAHPAGTAAPTPP